MKLVNSHVMTIDGVGELLESEMNDFKLKMKNTRYASLTIGPCTSHIVVCLEISDLPQLLYLDLFLQSFYHKQKKQI